MGRSSDQVPSCRLRFGSALPPGSAAARKLARVTNFAGEAVTGATALKAAKEPHKTFDYLKPRTAAEGALVELDTGTGDAAAAQMFDRLEATVRAVSGLADGGGEHGDASSLCPSLDCRRTCLSIPSPTVPWPT